MERIDPYAKAKTKTPDEIADAVMAAESRRLGKIDLGDIRNQPDATPFTGSDDPFYDGRKSHRLGAGADTAYQGSFQSLDSAQPVPEGLRFDGSGRTVIATGEVGADGKREITADDVVASFVRDYIRRGENDRTIDFTDDAARALSRTLADRSLDETTKFDKILAQAAKRIDTTGSIMRGASPGQGSGVPKEVVERIERAGHSVKPNGFLEGGIKRRSRKEKRHLSHGRAHRGYKEDRLGTDSGDSLKLRYDNWSMARRAQRDKKHEHHAEEAAEDTAYKSGGKLKRAAYDLIHETPGSRDDR